MKIPLIAVISVLTLLTGCKQVIREDTEVGHRLQINTFLMNSGFESLHDDPKVFEVGKYEGVPSNIKLKFNPFLNQYEMVVEPE